MATGADHRWAASAVALTRLPAAGSQVLYFHQGHAEQFSLPAPHGDEPIPPVRCIVTSIHCFPGGEEPYARISLLPANHSVQPGADTRPDPAYFFYYPKRLSHSDIQRSYLVVPNPCAVYMFPMFEDGSNAQALPMLDLNGVPYEFERMAVSKGNMRGDWAKFLRVKGLVKGDTVVFIRGVNQSLVLEARRQEPLVDHEMLLPFEEINESSERAASGESFAVTYYPGRGSDGSPFVVPRGAVDQAMGKQWDSGMEVRFRPRDRVLHVDEPLGATLDATGTIKAVTPGLVWRNIQVDLDASTSVAKNMWDIQATRAQPPVVKRIKTSTDPGLPGDDTRQRLVDSNNNVKDKGDIRT